MGCGLRGGCAAVVVFLRHGAGQQLQRTRLAAQLRLEPRSAAAWWLCTRVARWPRRLWAARRVRCSCGKGPAVPWTQCNAPATAPPSPGCLAAACWAAACWAGHAHVGRRGGRRARARQAPGPVQSVAARRRSCPTRSLRARKNCAAVVDCPSRRPGCASCRLASNPPGRPAAPRRPIWRLCSGRAPLGAAHAEGDHTIPQARGHAPRRPEPRAPGWRC
jgi:hypothetical protein